MLYWISLPYATFGVITQGATVARAAPIAGWAVGKAWATVESYYRRKGAQIEALA